jgi:Zn-dependent protease
MDMSPEFLSLGLIWFIVFLFSTVCHEAAHALVAKIGGDLTAFRGGQVTLNPVPHVRREPFGMVIVPLISYFLGGWMIGWASAPYDALWRAQYPRRAAWMSLAGPGANFLLMILAAVGIWIGILMGVFHPPDSAGFTHITEPVNPEAAGTAVRFAATFLSVLFFENLLLGTFNLLPVPPLDGSTGITVLMPKDVASRFSAMVSNPAFQMVGLLLAWRVFDLVFDPMFGLALNVLYPGAGYH